MSNLKMIHSKRLHSFIVSVINLFLIFGASADPLKIFICSDGETFPLASFAKIVKTDFDGSNIELVRTGKSHYLRGCFFDSASDKLFISDYNSSNLNDNIYSVNPDNSSEVVLQFRRNNAAVFTLLGGFAIDHKHSKLYWPDISNSEILYASSVNPLIDGENPQNVPQIFSTSNGTSISSPFDLEINPFTRDLYIGSLSGGIVSMKLDGGSLGFPVDGGTGVVGIAVDSANNRIFYSLNDNRIMRADLDGSNKVDLTDVIGEPTHFTHRIFDIDYEADTNKIYWLENANPDPGFGLAPPPGKLRRANPDGTGVEDVVSDVGYRATFLSFQYGTLKPFLSQPLPNTSYITEFPLGYTLAEPPENGSVKLNFKQGETTIASLSMNNEDSVSTTISPFSNIVNSDEFVTASTGFPISEGTYKIELSYNDAAGNPVASSSVFGVNLVRPTPTHTPTATRTNTPTATSTKTSTSTPTKTATQTATNTSTLTPNASATPTVIATNTQIADSIPTNDFTPAVSPTAFPDIQCVSTAELPAVNIKGKKASLKITAIKGVKYKFSAKPIGSPARKVLNKSIKAFKNGKLNFTFSSLKEGLWEFSYSVKVKKVTTQSCPVQREI